MSQTEFHAGKLKSVNLENRTLGEFSRLKLQELGLDISDGLPSYYSDWLEYLIDESDKYFWYDGVLYEFIDHYESDDEECFCKLSRNKDDSISFVTQFYNGGTCLSEMLEEGFNDLDE